MNELYFSKSRCLLCEKLENGNYWVLNGHWEFEILSLEENTFNILGDKEVIVIPDLIKTMRNKFNKEYV